MMQLERKLGVLGYDSTHNQLQSSLENLLVAEETAKIARITAESRYRMIAGMDPDTIDESIETTPGTAPAELNLLRGQLAAAKANYSQLTAPGGLGPNHPRAKELQAQMDQLSREITTESRSWMQERRKHTTRVTIWSATPCCNANTSRIAPSTKGWNSAWRPQRSSPASMPSKWIRSTRPSRRWNRP
jgi:uncharacterized protein involved in exopolysaccharide biosynthesis